MNVTVSQTLGKIHFVNPNSPEQPAGGVYRWYLRQNGRDVTIYVGCAGLRRKKAATPSTLKRGIQEAQRSCVSSDKGLHLDTDFIVGTALLFFKRRGLNCYWEHISDDPKSELVLCNEHRPLLQTVPTNIDRQYRLSHPETPPWRIADLSLAEGLLLKIFDEKLSDHLSKLE